MDSTMSALNNVSGNYSGAPLETEPLGLRWTLRLIYIAVFLIGVVGNLVVCIAIIRRKRMHTSNNLFTFNLGLADLIVLVIYVPTQMAAFENHHNWPLGNFMCQVAYIIIPLCLSASIGILLAISCDRYRAIAHPLRARLTLTKVKIIIGIIWVVSFITSVPLLFVAGTDRPDPSGKLYCSELWPKGTHYEEIYWISIFIVQYVIPLTIIGALSRVTALKLRQNSFFGTKKRRSQVVTNAMRQRMKQSSKIANMLIGLVILYAICMLPQHVIYFWMTYGNLNLLSFKMYVFSLANVFPMANCAFHPIVYGTLNKEFAQVYRSFFALLRFWSKRKEHDSSLVLSADGSFNTVPTRKTEEQTRKSSQAKSFAGSTIQDVLL